MKFITESRDFKDHTGKWVRSWYETDDLGVKNQHHTLSDVRWLRMNSRCKPNSSHQKKNPNYIGCKNNFRDFQDFVEWSICEVGYHRYDQISTGLQLWALDKDIVCYGNKIYSEDTCIFAPNKVNSMLTFNTSRRGALPVGVAKVDRKANPYRCHMSMGSMGGTIITSVFSCKNEAHRFWQQNKITDIRVTAEDYKNFHPKLYKGLNNFADRIQGDYDNHRETIL